MLVRVLPKHATLISGKLLDALKHNAGVFASGCENPAAKIEIAVIEDWEGQHSISPLLEGNSPFTMDVQFNEISDEEQREYFQQLRGPGLGRVAVYYGERETPFDSGEVWDFLIEYGEGYMKARGMNVEDDQHRVIYNRLSGRAWQIEWQFKIRNQNEDDSRVDYVSSEVWVRALADKMGNPLPNITEFLFWTDHHLAFTPEDAQKHQDKGVIYQPILRQAWKSVSLDTDSPPSMREVYLLLKELKYTKFEYNVVRGYHHYSLNPMVTQQVWTITDGKEHNGKGQYTVVNSNSNIIGWCNL